LKRRKIFPDDAEVIARDLEFVGLSAQTLFCWVTAYSGSIKRCLQPDIVAPQPICKSPRGRDRCCLFSGG